jgi:hypothetical protein
MGTLTVTVSGFGSMPSAVSHSFTTYSDADFQRTLNWGKNTFNSWIQSTYNPSGNPAFVPNNNQIWAAIVHAWTAMITNAEQNFSVTVQPPIVIGP